MKTLPKAEFTPKKNANSKVANYLGFVMGMVMSVVILIVLWANLSAFFLTDSTTTEQSSTSTEIEPVVEVSEQDQLLKKLKQLTSDIKQIKDPYIWLEQNRLIIKTADELLSIDDLGQHAGSVRRIRLSAIAAAYNARRAGQISAPESSQLLVEAAQASLDDKDDSVVRVAKIALLKVDLDQLLDSNQLSETSLTAISDRILDLIEKYPDDVAVYDAVEMSLEKISQQDLHLALSTAQQIMASRQVQKSTRWKPILRYFSDKIILKQYKLDTLFGNRWINGSQGQRDLREVAVKLAEHKTCGIQVIYKIESVAEWFEQEAKYDQAKAIYQALVQHAAEHNDTETSEMARRFGINGMTRCRIAGKKIQICGLQFNGQQMDTDQFESQVVAVYFWSVNAPSSVKALDQLRIAYSQMEKSSSKIIAFCIDRELSDSHFQYGQKYPEFTHVYSPEESDAPSLWRQCPVSMVPHTITIDHRSIVVDVNVPIAQLGSAVQYLLLNQDSRNDDTTDELPSP